MNERLVSISGEIGQDGVTLGDGELMFQLPVPATVVYACVRPKVDAGGGNIDIQVGGTDAVTNIACATAATPGTWVSKHFGGTADPVSIAANAKIELDCNSLGAGGRCQYNLLFLLGA